MAKSSRSSSRSVPVLDQVRELLTDAERRVLESSIGAAIAKASREQVQAAMTRARTLRDKWRDLAAQQTRSSKRSSGSRNANARSHEKSALFDGAIKRFEARLAELGSAIGALAKGTAAKPASRVAAARKPSKPSKPARKAGNRTARATLRGELKQAARALSRPATKKPAPAAARAPAAPAVATTSAVSKPAAVAVSKPAVSKKVRKAAARKKLAAPAANQAFSFDVAKQRSARAAATAARVKFDGQTTRRSGHAMARGKRSQARRDGRSR